MGIMSSLQVQNTLNQINNTLKNSQEGRYKNYSCKTVSWDDVQRGTVGGSSNVSCWGSNITDTRLYAKDGRQLFTVRGDNWNERLGKVSSNDIALVATPDPSSAGSSSNSSSSSALHPFTLRQVLSRSCEFGKYVGLKEGNNLSDETLDKHVSIRFQTTFLPVAQGEKTALEFAPEAYNYNTRDDNDPRNLILLCTSQGLAIQQDGCGSKKLYHHAVDTNGSINRHWLEAESSNHKVGGSQVETKEEKEDAIQRGKATSSVIGVKGIGTRFNVLMTIQVPLKQKPIPQVRNASAGSFYSGFYGDEGATFGSSASATFGAPAPLPSPSPAGAMFGAPAPSPSYSDASAMPFSAPSDPFASAMLCSAPPPDDDAASSPFTFGSMASKASKKRSNTFTFGKSSAARVSRGSFVDTWKGLTVTEPKRHENEHITASIVLYYTCAGGVPTEQDVKAAIDDLEELYQSVETNGHLSEDKFNFMKSELTVQNMVDIETKLATQPPPPKTSAPVDFDVFPS